MDTPEQAEVDESPGAFTELFRLEPYGSGPLDGLSFAVKDLIDVAGHVTGCGNPRWRETHPPAVANAVCVDQLLAAGAGCVGKTVSDELAFSLVGENHFYGTPLNPRAPDRVPGGSSSGSASAVAFGLCDFALGTDTGGSVRVPAANCGLFGLRPSHGIISVAGVNPFAPTFDTVGLFARTADVLARAASVLLALPDPSPAKVNALYLVTDAFDLVDPELLAALSGSIEAIGAKLGVIPERIPLREIDGALGGPGLHAWYDTYCKLQWAEIWSSLGSWIEDAKPEFGPVTGRSFALTKALDRRLLGEAVHRREALARRLGSFLQAGNVIAIPTTPSIAPLKGSIGGRSQGEGNYYPRALSLTSIAGIGRLPQLTLPVADVGGVPVGLSLLAGHGQDALLLSLGIIL